MGAEDRRLIVEVDASTGEALDRMAASLGATPGEVAARILSAAAATGVQAAIKAANTSTWHKPRRQR